MSRVVNRRDSEAIAMDNPWLQHHKAGVLEDTGMWDVRS